MNLKGSIMKSKDKRIDPLPEAFSSEEEAGEFWDIHSTVDYEEYLEPVDITVVRQPIHYPRWGMLK